MNVKTNYILHMNHVCKSFVIDSRVTPFHISLYLALFQNWNQTKFSNPISICREEMMKASKIGSANTYTKCLKDLDYWGYIKYYPSHNYQLGSKIHLYSFDKTSDKTSVMAVRPSINNIKHIQNNIKGNKQSQNNNSLKSSSNDIPGKREKKEKSFGKKEKKKSEQPSIDKYPTSKEIENHFTQNQWPAVEAEKFFNHYESNGWLIGGRSPMKNWKAASRNWMLNSTKFNPVKQIKPGNLNVTTKKNYNEPL